MFFSSHNTRIINDHKLLKGFVFGVILILFIMESLPVCGQILPYSLLTQLYLPLLSNNYFNNYSTNSLFNTNPYIGLYSSGLYNTLPAYNTYNSFAALNRTPYYPQATLAGSLIPFGNPYYTNPFLFPYNAAAVYFAAAVTPANVAGSWAGQWVSTLLTAGVVTGDLSITLAQNDTDVSGTAVFLLNKILKYGAYVVGTVEGNVLTLTSTVVTSPTGTMTYDVSITATVTDTFMEGTYKVINLSTGLVTEQGSFTANRL
ncbi:hypothetical protein JXL19_00670 [bacterium]|nr:hypothetical protein [bacterium]